ncbi:hypothetical protein PanWU01x14_248570 [Parasponia andersonii]|uniref:Uncharacterized protein n=1 Tax=Parasponia andersonii TaxID=3476 RepID=A0A2P5BDK9_PARAD|nr:hypothetical protein PanWU01x14_248570 [Parasponia andersonii]
MSPSCQPLAPTQAVALARIAPQLSSKLALSIAGHYLVARHEEEEHEIAPKLRLKCRNFQHFAFLDHHPLLSSRSSAPLVSSRASHCLQFLVKKLW